MARLETVVGVSRIPVRLVGTSIDQLRDDAQEVADDLYERTAMIAEYLRRTVVSVTAAYTPSEEDFLILANATGGAFSVTLPTAVGKQEQWFVVKRTNGGGNNVTIAASGAETIDGAASVVLAAQYNFRWVISDNANWHVIATG